MRYIGSKANLIPFIADVIQTLNHAAGAKKSLGDAFAGTAAVAKHFKRRGFRIISSDIMRYSYVFQRAYIKTNAYPPFERLFAAVDIPHYVPEEQLALPSSRAANAIHLRRVVAYLNHLPRRAGFMFDNYCPDGSAARMYFSTANALKIDAARQMVEDWRADKLIDETEYFLLVCAVVEAVPFVSNISGTYGAYLKEWDPRALKPIVFKAPKIIFSQQEHEVYQLDANELVKNMACDILYLDPPYNSRQYATNYHILETVAAWDTPDVYGVTGLRPYEHQKSAYCMRGQATAAFADLITRARCHYILLSYNNEGLIPEDDIMRIMSARGRTWVEETPYRRFKSDSDGANRQYKTVKVVEKLFCTEVTD